MLKIGDTLCLSLGLAKNWVQVDLGSDKSDIRTKNSYRTSSVYKSETLTRPVLGPECLISRPEWPNLGCNLWTF